MGGRQTTGAPSETGSSRENGPLMSPELIGILGVGAAVIAVVFAVWRDVRTDVRHLTSRVDHLTERVARIEGVIEGVLGNRTQPPS